MGYTVIEDIGVINLWFPICSQIVKFIANYFESRGIITLKAEGQSDEIEGCRCGSWTQHGNQQCWMYNAVWVSWQVSVAVNVSSYANAIRTSSDTNSHKTQTTANVTARTTNTGNVQKYNGSTCK